MTLVDSIGCQDALCIKLRKWERWWGGEYFSCLHISYKDARASSFVPSFTRVRPDIQQFVALRRLFALTRDGDARRRREEWSILPYLAAASR